MSGRISSVSRGEPTGECHVAEVVALGPLGWMGYRMRGIAFMLAAVSAAGLIGIAQWLYGGELFEPGINNASWVP